MNTGLHNELQQLQMELRAQNFDIIRFSSYRIACKLRFIQKRLNLHQLDLLNVIESLRESSGNCISEKSSNDTKYLSINHLQQALTSIYTNLNKRLPMPQQILNIDKCVQSAMSWFLHVYNVNNCNSIRFNSFRVALIILCNGKLIDKIRHLFTLYFSISLSRKLTYTQVDELLHEIVALPYALQEISFSTYRKNYAQSIFSHLPLSITFNNFLCILSYNNQTDNCLQWLIIFHRLISVENVIHCVKCSGCQRPSFSGFRYKCQQCQNRTYQLCQDCFWRGRTSDRHLSTHEMKEYTYFKSPNKNYRNTFCKTLKCKSINDQIDQIPSHLTINEREKLYEYPIRNEVQRTVEHIDDMKAKDKHLENKYSEKRSLIFKLEAKNRRILHEINTLRSKLQYQNSLKQMSIDDDLSTEEDDTNSDDFMNYEIDLHTLHKLRRARSSETLQKNLYYEKKLQTLLSCKHQLEYRLEQLNDLYENISPIRSYSAPSTPIHFLNNLYLATDTLTSAMSSLVQQLNFKQ